MEFSMRTVLITAVSAAAFAFVGAAPAFAQATVTGAPPGQAPVTVEGYGYRPGQPGQPGIGNDYPAGYGYGYGYPGYYGYGPGYGYYGWGPFGPLGAAAAGVVGAAGAVASGAVNTATYPLRRHCHVYRDAHGRRICGP
jgi:hypothetical protein